MQNVIAKRLKAARQRACLTQQRLSDQRLKDRIALITGASRGIGRAVALAYAREGAHVVLVARTVGGLEEVDDEIRALGSSATLAPLDLRDGEKVDGLGPTIYQR